MPIKNKVAIILLLFVFTPLESSLLLQKGFLTGFTQISCVLFAQELKPEQAYLFQGEVKGNDINIRSDSTINSEVICKVDKGQPLDVVSELYDWYKVKLPPAAPSFINKNFVTLEKDSKTAKVSGRNINVRLKPDTTSVILGQANEDDVVEILEDKGDWYRIKPIKTSFGWIHKNFISKYRSKQTHLADTIVYKDVVREGTLKPKIFTRIASHKLIAKDDNKVYLLKADIEDLNPFNNRKVKITGRLVDPAKQKYPIIEVEKIEALD